MTTNKPTQTQSQDKSKAPEYSSSTTQEDAIGAIKSLIDEAVKQSQETRPLALGEEAQKSAKVYAEIKEALATPTLFEPLTGDQLWELPILNETAPGTTPPTTSSTN